MKLKASYGGSASPAIISQIEPELERVLRDGVPALPPRKDLIQSLDVRTPYLETITSLVDWDRLRAAKLRFVVDPMHGAGPWLMLDLFNRQGG
jgi:phosphomannomutase